MKSELGIKGRRVAFIAGETMLVLVTLFALVITIFTVWLKVGITPILSDSMAPDFYSGDIVISKPVEKRELNRGDVVILPLPDQSDMHYAHRITSITNDEEVVVTTKGDNNPSEDLWRSQITSDTVPVVIASIPKLGLLNQFATIHQIRIVLGFIVMSLALYAMLALIRRSHE